MKVENSEGEIKGRILSEKLRKHREVCGERFLRGQLTNEQLKTKAGCILAVLLFKKDLVSCLIRKQGI